MTVRYVAKNLTAIQRAERVVFWKKNLEKFEQGTWRLYDVAIWNESWIVRQEISRKYAMLYGWQKMNFHSQKSDEITMLEKR